MSAPSTPLEILATGYGLVEGPRVDRADNLYFSDVLGGGVYRRSPSGSIDVVVPKRRGVGGIALHADGGLVVSGRNICHVDNGNSRVVFETDASFNDLFTDDDGRVLTGTVRSDPFDDTTAQTPGEAYRIGSDGAVEQLYDDVGLTNGIGFSPAGDQLYHADTTGRRVIAHRMVDGRPTDRRILVTGEVQPDGLAVDQDGTIWTAGYGAGAVIGLSSDGDVTQRIEVPAAFVTSLCFGGAELTDLYIVTGSGVDPAASGTIFRTRVDVPGLPAPMAQI